MKRVLFAFAALLLVAVGCENEIGKIQETNGFTTIRAVISDLDPSSRACLSYSDAYKQIWEEGDEISVFDGVSNVKFTLTEGAGTPTGTFTASAALATSDKYFAVYPYDTATAVDGDSLSVVFPYELTLNPATGCTQGGGNILVAKSEGNVFQFRNACSFVKLDLAGSELLESISLVCKEVESLAGTWKFAINESSLNGRFTRSATCLKVDCGEGLQLPAVVCIPVPPTVTNGFVVYATNKSGLSARAQASTTENISYNKVVEMPQLNVVCDKAFLEGMNFNKTVKSFIRGALVTNTGDYDSTVTKIVFLANQNMEGATGIPVGAGNDRSALASLDGGTLTVRTAAPKYHVNLRYLFSFFSGLEEIEGLDLFDTEISNSMYYTFGHCHNLKSVDLSHFNTENVTTMQYAFNGCWKLASIDCGTFNTSKVTSMNQMFRQCKLADPINISTFTSEALLDTYYMFQSCEKVKELNFNENFKGENIRRSSFMFYHCSSVTELDLRNFTLANDTTLFHMFDSCMALASLKQNFDTRNVVSLGSMFRRCESITELDLSNFNTEKVATFSYMFRACGALRKVNLSGASTQGATGSVSYMFGTYANTNGQSTDLHEVVLGPNFDWFSNASSTSNFWSAPSRLFATAEDPLVIKCSLNFAQGAVKVNHTNLLTPLKDGRIVLKNLNGKEFLYDCEKSAITKDTVLTDPDA